MYQLFPINDVEVSCITLLIISVRLEFGCVLRGKVRGMLTWVGTVWLLITIKIYHNILVLSVNSQHSCLHYPVFQCSMSILITISHHHLVIMHSHSLHFTSPKYFPQPHHLNYLDKYQTHPAWLRSLRVVQDKSECSQLCFYLFYNWKINYCCVEIVANNQQQPAAGYVTV